MHWSDLTPSGGKGAPGCRNPCRSTCRQASPGAHGLELWSFGVEMHSSFSRWAARGTEDPVLDLVLPD